MMGATTMITLWICDEGGSRSALIVTPLKEQRVRRAS
jgi:hypothetical protein